jgi:hypothetical protein
MKEQEVKKFIRENKTILPLSFHENLIFSDEKNVLSFEKNTVTEKQDDDSYSVIRFYKTISRF